MHLQRVGDDENPAERSLSNGPQRARRTVADGHIILENRCPGRLPSISRRRAGVILPGYVSILSKSTDDFVKQGGTAGNVYYSSLAGFSAEGVFLLQFIGMIYLQHFSTDQRSCFEYMAVGEDFFGT